MWVRASGQLSENIFQLTTPTSSHCLIVGEVAALVDASCMGTAPHLVEELKSYLADVVPLKYVLLTHTHFDHLGGLPYILEYAPDVQVVASPLIVEALDNKEFRKNLYERNQLTLEAFKIEPRFSQKEFDAALKVAHVLGDGDSLELGYEVSAKLIGTPGHTSESACYYVAKDNALAGSESLGSYHGREKVYPAFNGSYQDYIQSLDKLSKLNIRVLSLCHSGALTGDLAGRYLMELRIQAAKFYEQVKELIKEGRVTEEICDIFLTEWQSQKISPDGPFQSAQKETIREMVQVVVNEGNLKS